MRRAIFFIICLLIILVAVFYFSHQLFYKQNSIKIPMLQVSPTSTIDLSAILITADKDASILVVNSAGQPVGTNMVNEGIRPPNMPTAEVNPMKPIREYVYQKPPSGTYTVTVTVGSDKEVSFYLYNQSANVVVKKFSVATKTTVFRIQFDKTTSSTVAEL